MAKVSLRQNYLLLPHIPPERLTEFWLFFVCILEVYFLWCPLSILRTLQSVDLSLVRWLFASVSERPFFLPVLPCCGGVCISSMQSSSIFSENSDPLHSTSFCGEIHLDVREFEVLLIFLYFWLFLFVFLRNLMVNILHKLYFFKLYLWVL